MSGGIAFTLDESQLLVADSAKPHRLRAFDVKDGRTLTKSRVFAECDAGIFDGCS